MFWETAGPSSPRSTVGRSGASAAPRLQLRSHLRTPRFNSGRPRRASWILSDVTTRLASLGASEAGKKRLPKNSDGFPGVPSLYDSCAFPPNPRKAERQFTTAPVAFTAPASARACSSFSWFSGVVFVGLCLSRIICRHPGRPGPLQVSGVFRGVLQVSGAGSDDSWASRASRKRLVLRLLSSLSLAGRGWNRP